MATHGTTIEELPLNGFHRLLTVRCGGGSFVDGYALSIIGVGMVQIASALHLDNFWQGIIAAAALLGIFAGGLVGGKLTDHFGRGRVIFIGPTLFVVFSLASLWVDSPWALFACRFLIGVGVGIEYPVATALLVEYLPRASRGPRLAALTLLWFAGAAAAYILGNWILAAAGEDGWRWALASTALVGAALFAIRLGTPESARWLLNKGRTREANGVLRRVFGAGFSVDNLAEQVVVRKAGLRDLLGAGYGSRLLFVVLFWTCSVVPVFAVYAFAPKVLEALHLHGGWAAYGSIAITLLFVVGCAIATSLINAVGRRPLLLHSFLWSGAALLLLGTFADAAPWLVLLLFGSYALFIGGAQVLQLVYPNELFPTEIRAVGVGIGTSMSRIGAAVGTYLVPLSLQHLGITQTMYIAAAVTAVGFIAGWFLAPETASLDLAQASALSPSR